MSDKSLKVMAIRPKYPKFIKEFYSLCDTLELRQSCNEAAKCIYK